MSQLSYTVVGACITHTSNPSVQCTVNCPTEDSWENFQAGWRISGGTISTAKFVDGNGKIIATLVNYACHPTIMGPSNRLITPDYPGAMKRVEKNTIIGI